eukprot:Gregarina_sp_Poly_1__1019@NODE_1249_length_4635_cov_154_468914_g850_i0_p3_GENE_NODE_1249_length_4635_cov_154_468914_g850_i0NODE_1249_length_4635_cov_154_468914_g850_i0_p3_ORF_typecomplete_len312_score43_37PP2C/PF00481_21/0_00083_NODE_1249_length_4635_cov_154_468914_g850_i034294364
MGRSMGHAIFSTCGLSTGIDFSCLALKQIPKLLNSPPPHSGALSSTASVAHTHRSVASRCFRLPPLSNSECRRVIESFIKSAEASALRRPKSEVSSFERRSLRRGVSSSGTATENALPPNSPPLAKLSDSGKPKTTVSFPERSTRRSLFAKRDSPPPDDLPHPDGHASGDKKSTFPASSARAAFIRCFARGGGGGGGGLGTSGSDSNNHQSYRLKSKQSVNEHPNNLSNSHPSKVGDMFLLLMSDGVTDVLSSSCIVEMLRDFDLKSRSRNKAFDPAAFSLALTEVARERRLKACQRADNCTCLAVHLIPE